MEVLMVGNSVGNGDARGRNGTLVQFAQLPCRACPTCISSREALGHLFTKIVRDSEQSGLLPLG